MVLEWLDGKPLDAVLWDERRAGLPARTLHEAHGAARAGGAGARDRAPAAASPTATSSRRTSSSSATRGRPAAYVKVLDFGIAKVMAEHAGSVAALAHTGTDITSFTPNYGAPEQFSRSHGATGPWTDVFAMALILVEILRGGQAALDGDDFMQIAVASRDPQRRPTPAHLRRRRARARWSRSSAGRSRSRRPSGTRAWASSGPRSMHAVFPDAPTWQLAPPPAARGPPPSAGVAP